VENEKPPVWVDVVARFLATMTFATLRAIAKVRMPAICHLQHSVGYWTNVLITDAPWGGGCRDRARSFPGAQSGGSARDVGPSWDANNRVSVSPIAGFEYGPSSSKPDADGWLAHSVPR